MNSLIRFFHKLSLLIRREKFSNEMDEEIAFHREQVERELRAAGMAPESAHRAASRKFGNATRLKERSREIVEFRFETVLQDFRFALRQLRKNPGFTGTAVGMLALGMCASVAMFAFADAALIKPLPYPAPNRLVEATESAPMIPRANLSYLDYLDWKKLNTVFTSLDVITGTGFLVSTPSGAEPASGTQVSDGFFHTLGVIPAMGRDFRADDGISGAPQTVILAYAAWQKWFGSRPDVIGQPVILSGISHTIIGVLPRDFCYAPRPRAQFWTTLPTTSPCHIRRTCHDLTGVARLKDGVSVSTALADMQSIAGQLETQYPDSNRSQGASVMALSDAIVGDIRPILLVTLGGAGLLLLISCVNVTSLLLVRSESRKREISVRGALGASTARLIRQFATEGLLLVTIGGAFGLLAARWTMQLLLKLIPADMLQGMPFLQGIDLNLHVLVFACSVALLASALFSLIPTWRLPFSELREGLTEGGRTSAGTLWRRFGSNLVVVELAVAIVLLFGAGLLGKSLHRLLNVDPGFHADHLANLEVDIPDASYPKEEDVTTLARKLLTNISSVPGVKSAAITSRLPFEGNGNTDWIRFVGRPYDGKHIEVNMRDVSPNYLATLQAKLLRGRFFTEVDDASKPKVVIINQTLARKYFPGEDPIGKKFGDISLTPQSLKEIVGVVDDIREGALDAPMWPAVYYPFDQDPDNFLFVVARTESSEQSVLPTLVATVHRTASNLGTTDESTMASRIEDSPTAYLHRSSAWLVGGFAALAFVLSVVGLYGVVAYSVSQRTREIAIRVTLGAQRSAVYQMVLQEAGRLATVGILSGLVCAVAAASLMRGLLFGVPSWDVSTLATVAAALAISALLASYIPARRAALLDPVESLRAE